MRIRVRRLLPTLALALASCGAQAVAAPTAHLPRVVLHESTDATSGVTDSVQGYTFDSSMSVLPPSQDYQFRLLGPDGQAQTAFLLDGTKLLHFMAVRDDLTDFVHVHPTLAPDGTWSIHLPLAEPGPYHLYIDFLLRDAQGTIRHMVLRRALLVPGAYRLSPIVPAPSPTGEVDGYQLHFDFSGIRTMDGSALTQPRAWTVMYMPATITYQGRPVTDIEPYLAAYAHFTAINVSTGLYGHAHPLEYAGGGRDGWPALTGLRGGPNLTFHAEFPGSGDYRAFVEFQTAGKLHTAELTIHVQ